MLCVMANTKVPCSMSLERSLIDALDAYAKSLGESRSTVAQRFIREGLKKAKRSK